MTEANIVPLARVNSKVGSNLDSMVLLLNSNMALLLNRVVVSLLTQLVDLQVVNSSVNLLLVVVVLVRSPCINPHYKRLSKKTVWKDSTHLALPCLTRLQTKLLAESVKSAHSGRFPKRLVLIWCAWVSTTSFSTLVSWT